MREYAAVPLRLIAAIVLILGTLDNVLSWDRMLEFEKFIAAMGGPFPLVGAVVSVWAQFICGFLILIGLWTRPAAAVMVINFIAAMLIAHRNVFSEQGFFNSRPALLMLAISLFLFMHGPGRPSIDERRRV